MDALRSGTEMFLDACLEPEVQRIVLLDAPAVLGWERWREIAADHGLGLSRPRSERRWIRARSPVSRSRRWPT